MHPVPYTLHRILTCLMCITCFSLFSSPVSVLRNSEQEIPLIELERLNIAILRFPEKDSADFFSPMVNNYKPAGFISPDTTTQPSASYNYYLIKIAKEEEYTAIEYLQNNPDILNNSILFLTYVPSPETISFFPSKVILCAEYNSKKNQETAAKMIFGGIPLPGDTRPAIRFNYTSPEEAGMDSTFLYHTIDSILNEAITNKAFPGCQILIAKDRNIVMNKSYGYHTYSHNIPVENDHVYDLASVSKTIGGTIALMKLVEEGILELDRPFSDYWKYFKRKDKKEITLRELLTHQAGLVPYISFHRYCFEPDGTLQKKAFSYTKSKTYNTEVYHHMFAHKKYRKYIHKTIAETPLGSKTYRYSDLSFLIYPEVIREQSGKRFDQYLYDNFYQKIGADNIRFTPAKYLPLNRIVPTENDEYFRHALIKGHVHDESAAMLGGISANAGVFGNATDIAKILQMLLQNGEYGGRRFLSENTVKEFTRCQFPENNNRRALGFDKPLFGNDTLSLRDAYPAPCVSPESYGHTGFTGTFYWVDPAENLIYILLTNRVFPTRNNNLLGRYNIRNTIQQAIYDSILE